MAEVKNTDNLALEFEEISKNGSRKCLNQNPVNRDTYLNHQPDSISMGMGMHVPGHTMVLTGWQFEYPIH